VVVQDASSPLEREVDRLVHDLLQKRRTAIGLLASLQELQVAMRGTMVAEAQRPQVDNTMRQLRAQLASLDADGTRIRKRLEEICAADRQPTGWVGIYYSASASALQGSDGRVVMRFVDYPSIESVEPGSPADRAGVRGGDRMLAMAGRDLRDAEVDFTPLLRPGTRIPIKVRRGVETKLLTVTVEPRPDDYTTPCPWVDERLATAFAPLQMRVTITSTEAVGDGTSGGSAQGTRVVVQRMAPPPPASPVLPAEAAAPAPPVPPLPPTLPRVGAAGTASTLVFGGGQFVAVGAELAEALGVERGLLLVTAGRGSPVVQSGLRAGDVLLSVDGEELTSPLVFMQAVEQADAREVRVQLLRKRRPMTVALRW
jgi:membrane-associated protease RseP (regulator of RpoE activity)